MKSIYVAGKFEEKDKVLDVHDRVRDLGHEVAYDWTTHDNIKPYAEHPGKAQEYCVNEVKAIANCDVFIYLTQDRGTTNKMEYGAALMAGVMEGVEVYAVGEHNTISPWFFHPDVKRVEDVSEVINELENE